MKARKAKQSVVAAIHEHGGKLVALAMRDAPGERRVLDTVECAAGALPELRTWLRARGIERVVRVAPVRETLCKSVPMAAISDEQALTSSLALMAEGTFPASVPAYRRAGGPLHASAGGAILCAWLAKAPPAALSDLPETWITLHGALAALWDGKGVAVYSDGGAGAAGLLIAAPAGPVARVVLESPAEPEDWSQTLGALLRDTAHAAGVALPALLAARGGLMLDSGSVARLREELPGASASQPWLDVFGVCAGALLAACSARESVRPLAELYANEPPRERALAERCLDWLANPVHAWALAGACLILALLLPWGFAYGRQMVLAGRAAKFEQFSGGVGAIEKQGALYSQLDRSRWPMTKLLTDLSRAAPEGVTAINLRLANGQPLNLHGSARSADLVNEFQARLTKTKVFGKVTVGRVEAKGDAVEFDLAAEIVQPNLPVTGADDFASPGKTLAERLYGAGASNTAVAEHAPASATGKSEARRDRASEPAPSPETGPPPAMTDAEIGKMTRTEAVKGWTSRKAYVQMNPGLESSVKQRLQDEEQKMRAQAAASKEGK